MPLSAARVALFEDATIAPEGPPMCEVVTVAKRDLNSGQTLDGIGGFMSYGEIDNIEVNRKHDLLPIGLSEGCVLTRDITKDQAISFEDVELPDGRFADELWQEQRAHFQPEIELA